MLLHNSISIPGAVCHEHLVHMSWEVCEAPLINLRLKSVCSILLSRPLTTNNHCYDSCSLHYKLWLVWRYWGSRIWLLFSWLYDWISIYAAGIADWLKGNVSRHMVAGGRTGERAGLRSHWNICMSLKTTFVGLFLAQNFIGVVTLYLYIHLCHKMLGILWKMGIPWCKIWDTLHVGTCLSNTISVRPLMGTSLWH